MLCLGIESTAHTFGVALTDGKKDLLNKRVIYTTKGGIHPREASQFIAEKAPSLLTDINIKDVDLIAFSQGPGLGPCLQVGLAIAKAIAIYYEKPLIGVNHCIAHIEVGKWDTGCKDPLVIYTSGANTQIIALKGGKYRIFGETLDIGIGNATDVFGRTLGFDFPAGPKLEKLAKKGKNFVELPYTVKGMDLAFAGLVTAAGRKAKKAKNEQELADLAYSFQETIFGMLVEVSERALAHTEKREVMLVGGVAQNTRLREMFTGMAKQHEAKFLVPQPKYNGDNALMIAVTGLKAYKAGKRIIRPEKIGIRPKWRTDEVNISWES